MLSSNQASRTTGMTFSLHNHNTPRCYNVLLEPLLQVWCPPHSSYRRLNTRYYIFQSIVFPISNHNSIKPNSMSTQPKFSMLTWSKVRRAYIASTIFDEPPLSRSAGDTTTQVTPIQHHVIIGGARA